MMSVQTCSLKMSQSYFEKDGALKREKNYYTQQLNKADTWQGQLCDKYCINPGEPVSSTKFNALLANSGQKVSCVDVTFSAPKSVSICALCGDSKLQNDMREAHRKAVERTLNAIEKNEIGTRIRNGKSHVFVPTGKMLAAKFEHNTARAVNSELPDPQLHTHCCIMNAVEYNNKIYTLDAKRLYNTQKIYGAQYRAALAQELKERGYNIEITSKDKGEWQLRGIDQNTIDHFSKRRKNIEKQMLEDGMSGAKAAQKASLKTRNAKKELNIAELQKKWCSDLQEMKQILPTAIATLQSDQEMLLQAQQKAYESAKNALEAREFAWNMKTFEEAICAYGVDCNMTKDRADELIAADKELLSAKLKTKSAVPFENKSFFTTTRNIRTEKEIFEAVKKSKESFENKALTTEQTKNTLSKICKENGWKLQEQQEKLVQHICTSKDSIVGIQGLAGTGKTFSLNATRAVLEANGYEVRGMAPSGQAAQELAEDAGLVGKCGTMHKILNEAEKEAGNAKPGEDYSSKRDWNFNNLKPSQKPTVWFVDEASLADNNTLNHVLKMAELRGDKVALVGDDRQLQPVGTGKAFTELVQQNKISYCRLDNIQRQKNLELLNAVKEAVLGDAEKSWEMISSNITEIKTPKRRLEAATKEYCALSPVEQKDTAVLAAKNADRIALNSAIRENLVKSGQIQRGQEFTIQPNKDGAQEQRFFAPGDKIIFLKNDLQRGVMNGTKGQITAINGETFTVDIGKEKPVEFSIHDYNNIEHGYCLTSYKSQGMTTKRTIIVMNSADKRLNARNSYYVNISRSKEKVSVYVDDKEKIAPQIQKWAQKYSTKDFVFKSKTAETAKTPIQFTPKKILTNIVNLFPSAGSMVKSAIEKAHEFLIEDVKEPSKGCFDRLRQQRENAVQCDQESEIEI